MNTSIVPSSSQFGLRCAVGYTGPRPQNMRRTRHAYDMHWQTVTCSQDTSIVYTGGEPRSTTVSGGILANGVVAPTPVTGSYADFTPRGDTFAAVHTRLRNRCLDEINDKFRGGVDLSVDLAEAGQTAKMARVIKQVEELATKARRSFGPLRTAGALVLMTQYGLKPLLSTIFECALRAQNLVVNRIQGYSARAFENVEIESVNIASLWGTISLPASGMLAYKMKMGVDLDTRAATGLASYTSLNPYSIAWELLPLSFVVDWLLNVGGYLRALETSVIYNNDFYGGFTSELVKGSVQIWRRTSSMPGTVSYSDTVRGQVEETRLVRTLLLSYPRPDTPMFGADLGSSRLISAAALLTTLMRK